MRRSPRRARGQASSVNDLLAAKADTETANQMASSMTTERDKMSASKNYYEELLTQSAKSLQEAINERDQAQVLLKTTQDAMTADFPTRQWRLSKITQTLPSRRTASLCNDRTLHRRAS